MKMLLHKGSVLHNTLKWVYEIPEKDYLRLIKYDKNTSHQHLFKEMYDQIDVGKFPIYLVEAVTKIKDDEESSLLRGIIIQRIPQFKCGMIKYPGALALRTSRSFCPTNFLTRIGVDRLHVTTKMEWNVSVYDLNGHFLKHPHIKSNTARLCLGGFDTLFEDMMPSFASLSVALTTLNPGSFYSDFHLDISNFLCQFDIDTIEYEQAITIDRILTKCLSFKEEITSIIESVLSIKDCQESCFHNFVKELPIKHKRTETRIRDIVIMRNLVIEDKSFQIDFHKFVFFILLFRFTDKNLFKKYFTTIHCNPEKVKNDYSIFRILIREFCNKEEELQQLYDEAVQAFKKIIRNKTMQRLSYHENAIDTIKERLDRLEKL
jgi:hypothetical protein